MKKIIPKTKIICTLGPASSSETVIRKMMMAGMNVVRLNFSHGTHADHLKKVLIVRKLNKKYRRHIRILQDLEGYRIRIGILKKPVVLQKRHIIYLANKISETKVLSGKTVIPFDYEGDIKEIKKNHLIFIDDGKIVLKVKQTTKTYIKCSVIIDGILYSNKGVNIPGMNIRYKGLTEKDINDLKFAVKYEPDFIAQSFVRNAKDVLLLKEIINGKISSKIISKIECGAAVKNIDSIIEVSDMIMIARGDMGVSIPIYKVPFVQKDIIAKCNNVKKPVITATQMLESMTENIIPERAEVTDVANSVLDGTDYVMLSGETAKGKYPAETVKMMNDIVKYVEKMSG